LRVEFTDQRMQQQFHRGFRRELEQGHER
jgi:hypothetical protein